MAPMATMQRSASSVQSTVPVAAVVSTRLTVKSPEATPSPSASAYWTLPMSQPSMPARRSRNLAAGLSGALDDADLLTGDEPAAGRGDDLSILQVDVRLHRDRQLDRVAAVVGSERREHAGLRRGERIAVLVDLEARSLVAAAVVAEHRHRADEQRRDGGGREQARRGCARASSAGSVASTSSGSTCRSTWARRPRLAARAARSRDSRSWS